MPPADAPRRVAFIAGTLAQGGAEKQLVHMALALRADGCDVRVLCLTRGEHHEAHLRAAGVPVQWVGRRASPAVRLLAVAAAARAFRPHVVQAAHFYVNLYASFAARAAGAVALGAGRGDVLRDVAETGWWGPRLLHAADALVVNSARARRAAVELGRPGAEVHLLPNVVAAAGSAAAGPAARLWGDAAHDGTVTVAAVGRFKPAKRFDRFLRVVAAARAATGTVRGLLVGDGPDEEALRRLAESLALGPDALRFVGRRDDVDAILRACDLLLLTSDHEGMPNVVLEAMAARLPVVATDVGDVRDLVVEGETGFVVAPDNEAGLADLVVRLARDAPLRARLGAAGGCRVERRHSAAPLAHRLQQLYARVGA